MGLFHRDHGRKLSRRFVTARVGAKALVCQCCGGSIYEMRHVRVAGPTLQVFNDRWAALVCTGCGSVQAFAGDDPVVYSRPDQMRATRIPLKDGAIDDDGPAGLDLSAI